MKTVMVFGVFDGISDSDRHVFQEALEFGEELLVVVARDELSIPPSITAAQAKGFALYALRTVMSGRGDELLDLADTNVWRRIFG